MPTFKNVSTKNGVKKWSVVFDLPTNDGKRKQKRLSGFNTRTEANLAYINYLSNYSPPPQNKTEDSNFEIYYNQYINYLKYSVKESSYVSIESVFRIYIIPYFKNKVLSEIKSQDVTDWLISLSDGENHYNRKRSKELSYHTKKKFRGFLSAFFNYCINNDLLINNPCTKALKLRNSEIKKEMQIWSEEEFKKFISVIDNIEYKTFFSFLYLTGCRVGEVFAINWCDIIEQNKIKISKTLTYKTISGGYKITSPKNEYSIRDIAIPQILVSLLCELKEYYKEKDSFSENNFIFGNLKPFSHSTVKRRLLEYAQKANVKLIRIHDFRHSHASLLISKGHDIVTVSRRLGHVDVEMTLNRYSHLMPNKQEELLKSLELGD